MSAKIGTWLEYQSGALMNKAPRRRSKPYPTLKAYGFTTARLIGDGSVAELSIHKFRLHPTKGWRAVRPNPEVYTLPAHKVKWESIGKVIHG